MRCALVTEVKGMTNIVLHQDKSIKELMSHYNIKTIPELVAKGISMLKICKCIENTNGELIARKGKDETRIKVS